MGWARTLLLGDIGNRLDIADNEERVASLRRMLHDARRRDRDQDTRLDALARENDELKLLVAALTRLLSSKGLVGDAEIEAMVRQIDTEDGTVDAPPA